METPHHVSPWSEHWNWLHQKGRLQLAAVAATSALGSMLHGWMGPSACGGALGVLEDLIQSSSRLFHWQTQLHAAWGILHHFAFHRLLWCTQAATVAHGDADLESQPGNAKHNETIKIFVPVVASKGAFWTLFVVEICFIELEYAHCWYALIC